MYAEPYYAGAEAWMGNNNIPSSSYSSMLPTPPVQYNTQSGYGADGLVSHLFKGFRRQMLIKVFLSHSKLPIYVTRFNFCRFLQRRQIIFFFNLKGV